MESRKIKKLKLSLYIFISNYIMDLIGEDCEKIILDYKWQLEHIKKFKKCLKKIKKIKYEIITPNIFSMRHSNYDFDEATYHRNNSTLKILNDIEYYNIHSLLEGTFITINGYMIDSSSDFVYDSDYDIDSSEYDDDFDDFNIIYNQLKNNGEI
jgi:hypothetical protein